MAPVCTNAIPRVGGEAPTNLTQRERNWSPSRGPACTDRRHGLSTRLGAGLVCAGDHASKTLCPRRVITKRRAEGDERCPAPGFQNIATEHATAVGLSRPRQSHHGRVRTTPCGRCDVSRGGTCRVKNWPSARQVRHPNQCGKLREAQCGRLAKIGAEPFRCRPVLPCLRLRPTGRPAALHSSPLPGTPIPCLARQGHALAQGLGWHQV